MILDCYKHNLCSPPRDSKYFLQRNNKKIIRMHFCVFKYNLPRLCATELLWEILSWPVILTKIHSKPERKDPQCCILPFHLAFRETSITNPFWLLLLKWVTILSFHSTFKDTLYTILGMYFICYVIDLWAVFDSRAAVRFRNAQGRLARMTERLFIHVKPLSYILCWIKDVFSSFLLVCKKACITMHNKYIAISTQNFPLPSLPRIFLRQNKVKTVFDSASSFGFTRFKFIQLWQIKSKFCLCSFKTLDFSYDESAKVLQTIISIWNCLSVFSWSYEKSNWVRWGVWLYHMLKSAD